MSVPDPRSLDCSAELLLEPSQGNVRGFESYQCRCKRWLAVCRWLPSITTAAVRFPTSNSIVFTTITVRLRSNRALCPSPTSTNSQFVWSSLTKHERMPVPWRQVQTRSDAFSDRSQQRVSRLATVVKVVVTLALPTLQNLRPRKGWVSHQQRYRAKRVLSLHRSPTSPLPRPSRLHSLPESWSCFRLERYWHLPQALWRSDLLIHAMKENISCRTSNSCRRSTLHTHQQSSHTLSVCFVRSRPLLFERHKKETPGHPRVELQKRIDRFVVRAAFGVQGFGSFIAAFPKRVVWPSATARATKQRSSFRPRSSATNWALSATSVHGMVAITVKEADCTFRFRNFLKSVIGFYPPTQILMFYGLRIIPYIYGRPLSVFFFKVFIYRIVVVQWKFFLKHPVHKDYGS